MHTKSVCVLANSVKFSGSCIAGVEVEERSNERWRLTQNWVRPLSHRKGGELNPLESRLQNKTQPSILDIVDIPLQSPANVDGQPEDWLIERGSQWTLRGKLDIEVLDKLLENPNDLWLEYRYQPDRVSTRYLREHELPSLYLIRPNGLELAITAFRDDNGRTKKKRRAYFDYNGVRYDLAMTDHRMQEQYFPAFPKVPTGVLPNGPARDSILCISLTPELSGGYHYKLVATVIE